MNALRKTEDALASVWWLLAITLLAFSLACSSGCRFSRVVSGPDGQPTIVTEGSDLIPAVPEAIGDATDTPGLVEDAVGSVVEAVEKTDVKGAVEDVSEGDWFGLTWKLVALISLIGGGYTLRRKLRKKRGVA